MVLGLALFFFVLSVVLLGLLLFGPHRAVAATAAQQAQPAAERLKALEAEAEKRRREVDEGKALVNDLRAELKQVKRKLHEQRAAERGDQDLVRARTEVERSASQQLEAVRGELAHALLELAKLRSDAEGSRPRGRPAPVMAPPPPPATAATPAPVPVAVPLEAAPAVPAPEADRSTRRFRELSDADREKLERLEHQANRERTRALEFQAEVRRLKGRGETQHRVWVVTRGELDLLKDKFKALEKRLNRTLLERDLLKRALGELERRGGLTAGRTELTQEEIAASDQGVDERARAEAERLERRTSVAAPSGPPANGTAEATSLSQPLATEAPPAPAEQESAG